MKNILVTGIGAGHSGRVFFVFRVRRAKFGENGIYGNNITIKQIDRGLAVRVKPRRRAIDVRADEPRPSSAPGVSPRRRGPPRAVAALSIVTPARGSAAGAPAGAHGAASDETARQD